MLSKIMFQKWCPNPNLWVTYFLGALHLHGPSAKQTATFINTNVQNKFQKFQVCNEGFSLPENIGKRFLMLSGKVARWQFRDPFFTNALEVVETHSSTSWLWTKIPEGPSPSSHMNAAESRWMMQFNLSAVRSRVRWDEMTAWTIKFLHFSFTKVLYSIR